MFSPDHKHDTINERKRREGRSGLRREKKADWKDV
jgi:hypothetical protein